MQRRVQRQGRQVSSVKLQVGLDSDTGAKLDVRQQNETKVWKKWTKNLKNGQEKLKKTNRCALYLWGQFDKLELITTFWNKTQL